MVNKKCYDSDGNQIKCRDIKPNDKNKTNSEQEEVDWNNPFNGSKGRGTGYKFGKDHGNAGDAPGDLKPRVLLVAPKTSKIYFDRRVEIGLEVKIDAAGRVISATNIRSQTTTYDQSLINRVIDATKNTARYDARPNAPIQGAYITIKIEAR